MIPADRFIARSTDTDRWLAARSSGVSATAVARAATPAGFRNEVEARRNPVDVVPNEYMLFGSEAEADLMEHAHREHGILPNDWAIASADNQRFIATPDGLSPDHTVIAEAKTTGKDWARPPINYMRQVQFQLHVTGAERCLFLWNLRVPDEHGWFFLGWVEPKTMWLERDEKMISELVEVADRLLAAEGDF